MHIHIHMIPATLEKFSLACTHISFYARDIFSYTYAHTSCYARDIFSCTHTHTSFYARDIFSCTYTHTSCYATNVFCCAYTRTSCVAIYIFLALTHIVDATLETSFLAHTQGGKLRRALKKLGPVKPNGMVQWVFKIPGIFKVLF